MRKEVTIVDGVTVEIEMDPAATTTAAPNTSLYVQWDTGAPKPDVTYTVTHSNAVIPVEAPLWWKPTPVFQSSLYVRGTDFHICSLETPVPNWFRRQFAKLAGFEWREC